MAFPNDNLKQTAVYWGNPVSDGYGGFSYDEPIEISCRWVWSSKLITDAKGRQVVCTSEIQVDRDLDVDGILYLGTLADLNPNEKSDPSTVLGAYKINRFDKTPSIKADKYYRVAYV